MTLNEIVKTEHIVPELKATNRWEAIGELVDTLVANGAITKSDRDAVIDVVRTRENSMSTGIGYGIGMACGLGEFSFGPWAPHTLFTFY